MAEILSQEEIDSLLSTLDDVELLKETIHEEASHRVKEYDFKRPDKFSKDQIRTLHMLLEGFARSWATFLSGKLRALVYLELISIDQLPYSEYIRSAFTPTVISIFSLEPLEGDALIDISPPVAFAIIERLVGSVSSGENAVRELTEIEEALIENVVADALRVLKNSIADIIDANPRLETIEYNPQFTQIVPPSEIVLFISLEMRIEESRGMLGLCLPHMLLEPVLQDLSTERFFRRTKEDMDDASILFSRQILNNLAPTEMAVRVELGDADLSVEEVIRLEPGDIIRLHTRLQDPLKVYIGKDPTPQFLARPGNIGRHKGIEILDFYEE